MPNVSPQRRVVLDKNLIPDRFTTAAFLLMLAGLLSACGGPEKKPLTAGQAQVEYNLLYSLPTKTLSYDTTVRPVLERRCVACHGCYDAPCQLKLSSPAGIARGANKELVYDGARIKAADPTRLFIDAMTTAQWRQKGFQPVLNENTRRDPVTNLENSVLYRMLRLKRLHPQARTGMLSDTLDVSLDREQTCPTLAEFDDYAEKHPLGGMPYAMPDLSTAEYTTLVHWLAQGAPMPDDLPPSSAALPQIERWEKFLNGSTNKEKLVGRYLYEHLFQAHLHFTGTPAREFYRLVRSNMPPGQPVDVIATPLPYGDPSGPVHYRIVRHQGSIVAKSHMAYELSDQRLKRIHELFIKPDYAVDVLPSYDLALASNPIKTFASLPIESRYRFLLDEARFFIEGFIKGPVCRGQIALNVIDDQFWVVFFAPDAKIASKDPAYLNSTAEYLASPAELQDNFKLISGKKHYKNLQLKYRQIREQYAVVHDAVPLQAAMKYIWDGDGINRNAALTIFRHYDSASISFGLVGNYPKTAWIIDYPLLERIHYLLVAGFNIYANLGHQLNTRLYMDFLRMEGEDYFLALLPANQRKQIRDSWYVGIRSGMERDEEAAWWISRDFVTGYKSNEPQRELYQHIEQHLRPVAGGEDFINRCRADGCKVPHANPDVVRVDRAMRKAARMDGRFVQFLPDTAFLRVRMGGKPHEDLAYTLISNKAYTSVSSMFEDERLSDRRDYKHDTQTVVRWLEGSYPSFFYVVDLNEIESFVERYNAITNRDDYEQFVARYGLRRTDMRFWENSDWFNDQYAREQPVLSGLLDLNRYENR